MVLNKLFRAAIEKESYRIDIWTWGEMRRE